MTHRSLKKCLEGPVVSLCSLITLYFMYSFIIFYFILCALLCMSTCMYVYLPWLFRSLQKSKEGTGYHRTGATTWFWGITWVLRTKPMTSVRAANSPNCYLYSLIGVSCSHSWPQNIWGRPWTSDFLLLPSLCWDCIVLETEPGVLWTLGKHFANWVICCPGYYFGDTLIP